MSDAPRTKAGMDLWGQSIDDPSDLLEVRLDMDLEHFEDAILAIEAEARGELDAAWAEAEAALPGGWVLLGVNHAVPGRGMFSDPVFSEPPFHASAREDWRQQVRGVAAKTAVEGGATPAAALRALAARLRERT